jgi:hypothetical protein
MKMKGESDYGLHLRIKNVVIFNSGYGPMAGSYEHHNEPCRFHKMRIIP